MTLYPLNIGGRYDPGTRTGAWTISNTPSGRRYRSARTVLSPAGLDLSRSENLRVLGARGHECDATHRESDAHLRLR